MLESVLIQNFKGFKNTSIGPFRKVNLLIGGQNVGKTSVLEVIHATASLKIREVGAVFRPHEGGDLDRFNKSFEQPGLRLTVRFLEDGGIVLAQAGTIGGHGSSPVVMGRIGIASATSTLEAWSIDTFNGPRESVAIPVHLPTQLDLVSLFGRVVFARKKRELVALLKQVDPRLEGLDSGSPDGEQRIYAEIESVPMAVPLTQMGHGFSRLVHLFSALLVADAPIALIDEVENGIHYTALPILFKGIKAVAKDRNVQSVITTHSWDCLRAACEVFEDEPDMFQVIRLERHDDDVKAVCIDGARMLRLMAEEREVR